MTTLSVDNTFSNEGLEQVKSSKFIDVNSDVTFAAIQAATNLCNETTLTRSVKTPISLLQEIAIKCSCQPIYENVSIQEQVHEPLFIFKVTVGDISAIAEGTSKKRAKHAAALSILNEIKVKSTGKNDSLAKKIETLINSINEANIEDNLDEIVTNTDSGKEICISDSEKNNPVGHLLELTQKFSLRPPIFEYEQKEELCHEKKFSCCTKFEEFEEIGYGSSKKIAKRHAARQLLFKLKSNPSFQAMEVKNLNNESLASNLPTNKDKHKKSGANFINLLKTSNNPTAVKILEICSEVILDNQVLMSLAKEENFKYDIFNLGTNKLGMNQILLRVKTNPFYVVSGLGVTIDEAVEKASFNFLSLIQKLCSR